MRFSLRTALALMTLLGLGLGMFVEHGLLGIGVLLPPALLVAGAMYLWRKGWRAASGGCIVAYLLLWGGTEIWGAASYQGEVEKVLRKLRRQELRPIRRITYDAFLDRTRPRVPKPWNYVGRTHSHARWWSTRTMAGITAPRTVAADEATPSGAAAGIRLATYSIGRRNAKSPRRRVAKARRRRNGQ